ncbi:unnamed protein product [Owenia fusiformis]|uniref:Uncharacterized protein n=1 Tax=Owenia fusiformis TaxID=6347 RepID=A0A8S4N2W9_OWEFU|nr:unnamed protein product [Owenia fusiformis]
MWKYSTLLTLLGLLNVFMAYGQDTVNSDEPTLLNLATNAEITVNATCGLEGPETYCKLVDHVRRRFPFNLAPESTAHCRICDNSTDSTAHPIGYAIDGSNNWWQSPTLTQGRNYEWITITLDIKQIYQVAYIIVKAANSPRPGNWILERSLDGIEYKPWQYYALSDSECWNAYGIKPTIGTPIFTKDDEVICTSYYSKLDPLENGEIFTSLINGRPGIAGSTTLKEFTAARFIRLRLQRIRTLNADLMTIVTSDPASIDPSVTRRYFYSIKDISIGGQCICFGHAEECPVDQRTGTLRCRCEHNTCGDSCEKCCPKFNQKPWQQGSAEDSFVCEECNCYGHSDECVYNATIAEEKRSINIRGEYEGGGVCLNCKHNTDGPNCETCKDGFYRPSRVPLSSPDACAWRCNCPMEGSTGSCIKDDTRINEGLNPGDCICREGYAGKGCDRCAPGFRGFPNCEPCPCNRAGSLNFDTCDGVCRCKANVYGEKCDKCLPGYFNLDASNPDGCTACFCFGITNVCTESDLQKDKEDKLSGWVVTDGFRDGYAIPRKTDDYVYFTKDDLVNTPVQNKSLFYWHAPREYLGNKLSSYGGDLTYKIHYTIDETFPNLTALADVDVILMGGGGEGGPFPPGAEGSSIWIGSGGCSFVENHDHENTVNLTESKWQIIDPSTGFRTSGVLKEDFMGVLTNLRAMLILATYHTAQVESRLLSVEFDTTREAIDGDDSNRMTSAEICECPPGYVGDSCESCAEGYRRIENRLFEGICEPCMCNNHSRSCDAYSGECSDCADHTTGKHCDECALGFYGDPTRGGNDDCLPCACPLFEQSNNFAEVCVLNVGPAAGDGDSYTCIDCPDAYAGPHCEQCADGYFGDPLVIGDFCRPCECSGNVDLHAVGNCDRESGQCLKCIGNTEGFHCEKCVAGYFGTAYGLNCTECACNPHGSTDSVCDIEDGQCTCKPLFTGRDCGRCEDGFGNVEEGCLACECSKMGSTSDLCDPVSGQCPCKHGVNGMKCEECQTGYFGFTEAGCESCNCYAQGTNNSNCDVITGQCECLPNVEGAMCDTCKVNHYGIEQGQGCEACMCDPVGSMTQQCNDTTGQCQCKPGVTGRQCDRCANGYFGLSENGCEECPVCLAPGQVCDPETGECVCPPYTIGDMCEDCDLGAWGHDPIDGCKPCNCDPTGSTSNDCDLLTGKCECNKRFSGDKCDECKFGHFNFPECKPCHCNEAGTDPRTCDEQGHCGCSQDLGLCTCKANTEGKKCGHCKEGYYNIAANNPEGCMACFCFGKSNICSQAPYSWVQVEAPGQGITHNEDAESVIILRPGPGLPVVNPGTKSVRIESVGGGMKPVYWSLPQQLLGDKIISYNGKLRFTIRYSNLPGINDTVQSIFPLVQLVGNNRIYLEYYINNTLAPDADITFEVPLHEDQWFTNGTYSVKRVPVSRATLMAALQNVQAILVRATEAPPVLSAEIRDISLDVAMATNGTPNALGVEMCTCPPEYTGLSCQDPADGYFRKPSDNATAPEDLIGSSEKCQCNGHSKLCDKETGVCYDCQHLTSGDHCEKCIDGYYGDTSSGRNDSCKPCACPLFDSSNNFSPTCELNEAGTDYVCNACPEGYTGDKCERCADDYYGDPTTVGGSCIPCLCNPEGSFSGMCDNVTGQCECFEGVLGRACDECEERYAVDEGACVSCDEGCTSELMEAIDELEYNMTANNLDGVALLPWERMFAAQNLSVRIRKTLDAAKFVGVGDLGALVAEAKEDSEALLNKSRIMRGESLKNALDGQRLANESMSIFNDVNKMDAEMRASVEEAVGLVNAQLKNQSKSLFDLTKALGEAEMILDEIVQRNFFPDETDANTELKAAQQALKDVQNVLGTVDNLDLEGVKQRNNVILDKINDLKQHIAESNNNSMVTQLMTQQNKRNLGMLQDMVEQINNDSAMVRGVLDMAKELNENAADMLWNNASKAYEESRVMSNELVELSKALFEKGGLLKQNIPKMRERVQEAQNHSANLEKYADELADFFKPTKDAAVDSLAAASVYVNIIKAINESEAAANDAKDASDFSHDQAMMQPEGTIREQAAKALQRSKDMMTNASAHLNATEDFSERLVTAEENLAVVDKTTKNVKVEVDYVNDEMDKLNETNGLSVILGDVKLNAEDIMERSDDKIATVDNITNDMEKQWKPKLDLLKNIDIGGFDEMEETVIDAVKKFNKAKNITKDLEEKAETMGILNNKINKNIMQLKDRIMQARQQANTIKTSIAASGSCVRAYKPDIRPSTSNTISMHFKTNTSSTDMLLFYIQSNKAGEELDYMAIELLNKKVRFMFDNGAGSQILEHPLEIENANYEDINENAQWYRIEANRFTNVGTLSVRKMSTPEDEQQTVTGTAPPTYTRMDIDSDGLFYIGGVPKDFSLPSTLKSNTFIGCIGDVTMDGKTIGLYNFREVEGQNSCGGCTTVPSSDAGTSNTYQFDGTGYVTMPPFQRFRADTLGIKLEFRSFWDDSLLFFAGNEANRNFASLQLIDGRVKFHYNFGDGSYGEMITEKRYNTNEWVKVVASRKGSKGQLTVGDEVIGGDTTGEATDLEISTADLYFGGISLNVKDAQFNVTAMSFLGCMRDISVTSRGLTALNLLNGKYIGMQSGCRDKSRVVGFPGTGFLEIPGEDLPKDATISLTFQTYQPDTILMVSKPVPEGDNFYIALRDGYAVATFNPGTGQFGMGTSKRYNDGELHTLSVVKQRRQIQLIIDDQWVGNAFIPRKGDNKISGDPEKGLYIGGVPQDWPAGNVIPDTAQPFRGCIRDVVINSKMKYLENAVSFEKADVGRCQSLEYGFNETLPAPAPTGPTLTTAAPVTVTTAPSILPIIDRTTEQPATEPPRSCIVPVEDGIYTVDPIAVALGLKNSHAQINVRRSKVRKDFNVTVEFRTYYKNGLIFYVTNDEQSEFVAVQIVDGQIVLLFSDKEGRTNSISSQKGMDDGKWHQLVMKKNRTIVTLKVDNGAEKQDKIARKIDVQAPMYVGGLPEIYELRSGLEPESFKGCMRKFVLNDEKIDLANSKSIMGIGSCYETTEKGVYFNGDAYAIYRENYNVGTDFMIKLEFRTHKQNGILLSISSPSGTPALALSLHNGKIMFSMTNKNGKFSATSNMTTPYALCDSRWHQVIAQFSGDRLVLKVDDGKSVVTMDTNGDVPSLDTSDLLFFGGYPVFSEPQGATESNEYFEGCMKNVEVNGEEADWYNMYQLVDVHLSSCPIR